MTQCSKCGKKSKFFGEKVNYSCDQCEEADVFCLDCARKNLKKCNVCEGQYCSAHHLKHECMDEDLDEEDSQDVSIADLSKLSERQLLVLMNYQLYLQNQEISTCDIDKIKVI